MRLPQQSLPVHRGSVASNVSRAGASGATDLYGAGLIPSEGASASGSSIGGGWVLPSEGVGASSWAPPGILFFDGAPSEG